jgi:hypothetical protein
MWTSRLAQSGDPYEKVRAQRQNLMLASPGTHLKDMEGFKLNALTRILQQQVTWMSCSVEAGPLKGLDSGPTFAMTD